MTSAASPEAIPETGEWIIDGESETQPVLILAHGAGAGADTPFMTRMSAAIAARGVTVARFEFAYMRRRRLTGRRTPPPRAERLAAEWRKAIAFWREQAKGRPLFIGGKSMGGRVASLIADEFHATGAVRGLVCLGYPFHPPGRPERLRTAHLESLSCPALFCQGDRDPFGSRSEVESLALSPAIRFCWLPDGDHDFKPRVKSGETWEGNMQAAARCCSDFINALA
jgi:hypothetical protein